MRYEHLPREAHIKMSELATTKNKRGLTPFSEMTIRRLIKNGKFPQPKRYPCMPRATFFNYGEIQDWLTEQSALAENQQGASHE